MGDNMKRYAMDKLVYWKNKRNRKPLILKGARQVGKTWLMKEFGKKCFKNTAYINFDSDVRMRRIFEEGYTENYKNDQHRDGGTDHTGRNADHF